MSTQLGVVMRTVFFLLSLLFSLSATAQPLPEFSAIVGDPVTFPDRMLEWQQQIEAKPLIQNQKCVHKLFLSTSISTPDIQQWRDKLNAFDGPIEVDFRGIFTRRIEQTARLLDKIVDSQKLRSGVVFSINHVSFKEYKIDSVPAQLYACGSESLTIYGAVNPRHIIDEFEKGERGISKEGPTVAIFEKPLDVEIMERAAAVNLGAKAKENLDSYWSRQRPVVPDATATETKYVNMTFQVPQNYVVNQETAALAKNPVDLNRCVTFDLVIFNARNPDQVAWAEAQTAKTQAAGRRPILISTGFHSWKQLQDLNERLGGSVYLLDAHVAYTFSITASPSLLTQNQSCMFLLTQYDANALKTASKTP